MNNLKKIGGYLLYILAEAFIITAAMLLSIFVPKTFSAMLGMEHRDFIKIFMYVIVFLVLGLIYLYLFFKKKGNLFTPPLSIIFISLAMLIYFAVFSELRMEMGIEIFARMFILPVGAVSVVLSAVLKFIRKKID